MRGFLPKTTSAQTLAEVVRTVHAGGRYVDPQLAAEAVEAAWGPCEGLVITRYGHAVPTRRIEVIEGDLPNVPPLPPHIKLEQAKAYASVLLHGDPDQAGIIKQTAKQVLGSILPGHRKDKR